MFRLPNDLCADKKFSSFSSLLQNKSTKASHRQLRLNWSQSASKNSESIPLKFITRNNRPKSSYNRMHETKNVKKQSNAIKQIKFQQETLISPCNKKFQYFIYQSKINNINYKMSNSDFLLEPCKISQLFIQPKKQLNSTRIMSGKYQQSNLPYFNKTNSKEQKKSYKQKQKSRSFRQNYTSYPLRKQDLIQPWESSDCNFQSIRLNNKSN